MKKFIFILVISFIFTINLPIYSSELKDVEQELISSAYNVNETYLLSQMELNNAQEKIGITETRLEELKWWICNIKLMNYRYETRAAMEGQYITMLLSAEKDFLQKNYDFIKNKNELHIDVRNIILKYYNGIKDIENKEKELDEKKDELEEVKLQFDKGYLSEITFLEKKLNYMKSIYNLEKSKRAFEIVVYEIENVLCPGYKMDNLRSIKETVYELKEEKEYFDLAMKDNLQVRLAEKEIEIIDEKIAVYNSRYVYRLYNIGKEDVLELEKQKEDLVKNITDIEINLLNVINEKCKYIKDKEFDLDWLSQRIKWQEDKVLDVTANYEKGYYTIEKVNLEKEILEQQREQKDIAIYSINTLIIELEQYSNANGGND